MILMVLCSLSTKFDIFLVQKRKAPCNGFEIKEKKERSEVNGE